MMHFGLLELKDWRSEEYAAGYRARFSEIPAYDGAPHCWRCGWEAMGVTRRSFPTQRHLALRQGPWKCPRLDGYSYFT